MLRWLLTHFLLVIFLTLGCPFAQPQNIPPMIGTEIKNPGIKVPNPMEGRSSQQQNTSGQQPAPQAQETEISRFLSGLTTAYSNRNLEMVSSFYVPGIELTVFWNEKQFSGAETFKEEMQNFFRNLDTCTFELIEPKTHIFGRFAWVTTKCRVKTYRDGVESISEGTVTWVLERRKSVWTILHEHRNLLPSRLN